MKGVESDYISNDYNSVPLDNDYKSDNNYYIKEWQMIKEEFQSDGRKWLKVQPCGMLYTHGREYFLLHPYPVAGDWEAFERRFVCVPRQIIEYTEYGYPTYSFARHVVVQGFAIDYCATMPTIVIEKLEENDLTETEMTLPDFDELFDAPIRDVNDVIRESQENEE